MKWIHSKTDMPTGPHFAIIVFSSIWIPGDERSRTNPGHGYPEHNESTAEYIVFESEAEWKGEITKRMAIRYAGDNFVPLTVTPASVKTEYQINV